MAACFRTLPLHIASLLILLVLTPCALADDCKPFCREKFKKCLKSCQQLPNDSKCTGFCVFAKKRCRRTCLFCVERCDSKERKCIGGCGGGPDPWKCETFCKLSGDACRQDCIA